MGSPTPRDQHVDTAMSQLSIQYRNKFYIAEQVFPMVPVDHQSDVYFKFNPND